MLANLTLKKVSIAYKAKHNRHQLRNYRELNHLK